MQQLQCGTEHWHRRLTASKQRILCSTKWRANPWPLQQLKISEGLQWFLHFWLEERRVKVESGRSTETSVNFCQTARLHNPRCRILQVLQVFCIFQCPRLQAADVSRRSPNSTCSSSASSASVWFIRVVPEYTNLYTTSRPGHEYSNKSPSRQIQA